MTVIQFPGKTGKLGPGINRAEEEHNAGAAALEDTLMLWREAEKGSGIVLVVYFRDGHLQVRGSTNNMIELAGVLALTQTAITLPD